MTKGITKSGFKFTLLEEVLDDMELLDLISEVDENPLLLPKLIERLLGEKQKKRLYDHCRDDKGRVSSTRISDELVEIFSKTKVKN
ncbi:hypothetical protein WKS98_03405 [Lagierella sp. ICN-221743]